MDILSTLAAGLPVLIGQFAATLALLGLGVLGYVVLTPFDERALVRAGNQAAGTALSGTLVALAIPLAATLATSAVTLDILLWGGIALLLQLLTYALATRLIPGLRGAVEAGNDAGARVLVGIQIAVALLNAGAMAG